ncbi:MAG TPA: sigma-70 family RNA polymerase sigma factor [Thermoleophilaceae bacterium]
MRRISQQARNDRDSATGRLLAAYRDDGDPRARERLVQLYLPLVEMLAQRHDRRGADHDDLVQAGSIGLLNAIERFDRTRGDEFAAFAVPTIAGEIKRHLRDRTSTVRLPRRLHEASVRLPEARQELTARLGRAPSPSELAEALGVTADELGQLENRTNGTIDDRASDTAASELDASESRLLLADAFRSLDETERTIIYLRFVRERSRREAAEELRMSQSALARRTAAALSKLRGELEDRAFEQGSSPPAPVSSTAEESAPRPAPGLGPTEGGETGADEPTPASGTKTRAGHSGRLMLRMPQSLHAELAQAAEREEVSLNQFITNTLSAALRWHSDNQETPTTPSWMRAAIVTNIVVVVIAGAIALGLLIIAWQEGW